MTEVNSALSKDLTVSTEDKRHSVNYQKQLYVKDNNESNPKSGRIICT